MTMLIDGEPPEGTCPDCDKPIYDGRCSCSAWITPVRAALAKALIAISELPGPEPDSISPEQLAKVDKFTAFQLGHSMGIMGACQHLKNKIGMP